MFNDSDTHVRLPGRNFIAFLVFILVCLSGQVSNAALPVTIKHVKSSVVGVGTVQQTRAPAGQLRGTGFAVADGLHVLTNAHVVSMVLNVEQQEFLSVFVGRGSDPEVRKAEKVAVDHEHDLALLKILGLPLPVLRLGGDRLIEEGTELAFTGFPIGAILGLYPVTHHGIVSAITPIVTPMDNSRQLNPVLIKRLRSAYDIYQLDATAYPGNSGSPLFNPDNGDVVGIVNMVFVKETKESTLEKPSGISYAIPVKYARELLQRAKVPFE